MSRPRFLADNDLTEAIVRSVLRTEPAIEFRKLREFGLERLADAAVLDFAAREGFIVVSHDVTTMRPAALERISEGKLMGGLILIVQRRTTRAIIDDFVLAWSASEAEEWHNGIRFFPL